MFGCRRSQRRFLSPVQWMSEQNHVTRAFVPNLILLLAVIFSVDVLVNRKLATTRTESNAGHHCKTNDSSSSHKRWRLNNQELSQAAREFWTTRNPQRKLIGVSSSDVVRPHRHGVLHVSGSLSGAGTRRNMSTGTNKVSPTADNGRSTIMNGDNT